MTHPELQTIIGPRPNPKRVLVLGCTGMVGRSWIELLQSNKINCVGVSRPQFDLMNPDSITRCITDQFDLVVNTAAWTDVDGAESDESGANRANADAVEEIANRCAAIDATLITYSTDYVFAGDANTPYPIDAPINPINAYGRSKALGESKLVQASASHILIRTSWVYAPWGANFVRTIHNLAKTKAELRVVNDQQGRPTSAQYLAHSSLALYTSGVQGIWHLTDEDECTWFDLASEIVRYSNSQCAVNPCGSNEYPRPAPRPSYSTLDITESIKLLGPLGTWRTHLHKVLDAIKTESE